MNESVIKQALAKLKYTYPNSFRDYTKEDVQMMVRMWSNDFKNDDPKIFINAIERLRLKNTYCPSIAEIKKEIATLSNEVLQLNCDEEWKCVKDAIRRYGSYRESDALTSLKPETREVVKLIGWYRICTSENIEWERKTFKELFNNQKNNYEETLVLPEPVMTLSEITRIAKLKTEESDRLLAG